MILQNLKKYLLILSLLALPFMSHAWGMLGHRIIGEIAQSYLTPTAKKEVAKILGNESLAMSSNWLDFLKSDTSFNYLYNWHFINLKAGLSIKEIEAYLATHTATDAFNKINFLVKELNNKSLYLIKTRLYLRALVHIVGDIHQPMHVGRLEDQGGNKIKLSWFNEPSNLHRVWDEDLVASQKLSYTEYVAAINFTTEKDRKYWQSQPLASWITESYGVAQDIYAGAKQDDKLSYRYIFDNLFVVNDRLLVGGVRLAGLLNEIYSPVAPLQKKKHK